MKNLTIRQRIVASFGLILVLMVVMAVLDYARLERIESETRAVQAEALPGLFHSAAIRDAWSEGFLLTEQRALQSDPVLKEKIDAQLLTNREALRQSIADYESSAVSQEARRALDAFKVAQGAYIGIQNEIIGPSAVSRSQPETLARLNAQLASEFGKGEAAIQSVVVQARARGEESVKRIADDVSSARVGLLTGLVVALTLAFGCGISLLLAITRPLARLNGLVDVMRKGDFTQRADVGRRDELGALADGFNRMADELTTLVGQVKKSGLQVSTSVTEIAATAKEQQATANEVAATTTEIGATSREISATSKELLRTMNDVSSAAEQSAALAGTGQVGLTHMEDTMRHVIDAAGSVNAKLATLNEKAGDISQVVTTITKVADQTNLLSLNAAIEAEKAGEYGRGFSVVATEIRRLADQTAVATYDIDRMVKAIQSAVSAGVMSMDKFSEETRRGMQAIQDVGGQLTQVVQQVQALAPRFEAVTDGMQAQATGAEQITEALTQLSEAARQTVDSLRQSNLAIDDLNQVSLGLRNGVSRFTLQNA